MKNKVCPLTLNSANPTNCGPGCGWCYDDPITGKECAMVKLARVCDRNISDELSDVQEALENICTSVQRIARQV